MLAFFVCVRAGKAIFYCFIRRKKTNEKLFLLVVVIAMACRVRFYHTTIITPTVQSEGGDVSMLRVYVILSLKW